MSNFSKNLWGHAFAVGAAVLVYNQVGCTSKPAAPVQKAEPPAARTSARNEFAETLEKAAAQASAPFEGTGWEALFEGKSRNGWRETDFAGRGEVEWQSNLVVLNMGSPFTGINYTNSFPTNNYEIALDAMRLSGSDFFCGLTVPVGESHCSLIVGGWGGSLIGISSLDSMDASENETTKFSNFERERWYRIRLRVTEKRIEVWIDREKLIDVVTTGKRISVRPGDIELSRPLGIAAWQTTAALREMKVRPVQGPADPVKDR